jgi:hypothetical protein
MSEHVVEKEEKGPMAKALWGFTWLSVMLFVTAVVCGIVYLQIDAFQSADSEGVAPQATGDLKTLRATEDAYLSGAKSVTPNGKTLPIQDAMAAVAAQYKK